MQLAQQQPSAAIDSARPYEAVLLTEPVARGKTWQCDMAVRQGNTTATLRTAILRDSSATDAALRLHVGDGLIARSRILPPQQPWRRWFQAQGYNAQTLLTPRHWQKAVVETAFLTDGQRWRLGANRLRQLLVRRLAVDGVADQQLALVAALTLGDRALLSPAVRRHFSDAGAAHVLALSGLHLGILFGLLTWPFRQRRWRRWALGVVLPTIWAYTFLAGLTPSLVRSATMLTVGALVMLRGQRGARPLTLNALCVAAAVLLMARPRCLWDVGFQLSFLSVVGLLTYGTPLSRCLTYLPPLRHGLGKAVGEACAVSLSAQLCVWPLVLYYFGTFPTYFLVSNLVAVPCAAVLLYGAVFYVVLLPWGWAAAWVARGLSAVAWLLRTALATIAGWPGAVVVGVRVNAVQVVLFYVLLACATLIGWLLLRAARRSF